MYTKNCYYLGHAVQFANALDHWWSIFEDYRVVLLFIEVRRLRVMVLQIAAIPKL